MKILIVQKQYLSPNTNAGDHRLLQIIKILKEHDLTFFSKSSTSANIEGLTSVISDEQNVFEDLLKRQFDIVIFSHYMAYRDFAQLVRDFSPKSKLILDTVDLHYIREQRALKFGKAPKTNVEVIEQEETHAIKDADIVWVVSENEKKMIKRLNNRIKIVPTIHELEKDINSYNEREGIVFLGGYRHQPNVDAVEYFMSNIFPLVLRERPNMKFIIAGSNPPKSFDEYKSGNVKVVGYIKDHRKLLSKSRVGIAPLRYGAGVKGKILESFATGLPVVTTPIGAEGIGYQNMGTLVTDDPKAFAEAVIELYDDENMWNEMSKQSMDIVKSKFTPEKVSKNILKSIH